MMRTGQSYSSGEWLVREGSEEDFTEWSLSDAPGAKSLVLVRSTYEPKRFLSLGRGRTKGRRSLGDRSLGCRSC